MRFDPGFIASLAASRHTVVLTGSGISAESGIPTFRDAQTGLWARYRPEDLATPEAFARDPRLVWDWYAWRRERVAAAEPNPGHAAIAELTGFVPRLTLVTQNVDGLHQRAGSRDVIEFHGNVLRSRCTNGHPASGAEDPGDRPPRCLRCGAMLRPDVVWFGESIPGAALERAVAAARSCDAFLSIGTSALVQPAASLAELARLNGALLIEINPDETLLTGNCDVALNGRSGMILPALVAALKEARADA